MTRKRSGRSSRSFAELLEAFVLAVEHDRGSGGALGGSLGHLVLDRHGGVGELVRRLRESTTLIVTFGASSASPWV